MTRTWVKPALLVVGAFTFGVLVLLAANGLLALTGPQGAGGPGAGPAASGGATANASGGSGGGQSQAAASEKRELPGTWGGYKWYSQDLREQGMKFRDPKAGQQVEFVPKQMNNSTLPEKKQRRELIKYGRKLFANTSKMMPEHTGGDRMTCANCHGGGNLPTTTGMVGQDINMIPLVGTASGYPEWTGRTQRMRDMRLRIMGCFLRSMNADDTEGGIPEYTSREMQAMEAYMVWLNKDTPSQMVPYWRHLDKPNESEKVPVPEVNPVRGADLYLEHCASCHGKDGQGVEGQYPPLWGPDSFNDGAGMGRMYTSAAFIREAMPYGYAHQLTDWRDVQDIAGFMNAHKRPHLDRQPLDWKEAGVKKEGIYYRRAQEYWGYDMNPMTKKLMMAGIPIGMENVTESDIPDNVDKYDKPLKDADVDGSWRTTWIEPDGEATWSNTTMYVNGTVVHHNESSAQSLSKAPIEDAMAERAS
jgi:thiosulfate dehydrogenase